MGGGLAAVLDAGIAVTGETDAEVKQAACGLAGGGGKGEAEVGGEDGVGGGGCHVDLDGAALEGEQEGLVSGRPGAASGVESGGAADQNLAAAGEVDGGGAVARGDDGVGADEGSAAGEGESSGDGGGGGLNSADGGLGVQARAGESYRNQSGGGDETAHTASSGCH